MTDGPITQLEFRTTVADDKLQGDSVLKMKDVILLIMSSAQDTSLSIFPCVAPGCSGQGLISSEGKAMMTQK